MKDAKDPSLQLEETPKYFTGVLGGIADLGRIGSSYGEPPFLLYERLVLERFWTSAHSCVTAGEYWHSLWDSVYKSEYKQMVFTVLSTREIVEYAHYLFTATRQSPDVCHRLICFWNSNCNCGFPVIPNIWDQD